jgi:alpha-galactosidase
MISMQRFSALLVVVGLASSCSTDLSTIKNGNLVIDINENMQTKIHVDGSNQPLMNDFSNSESFSTEDKTFNTFALEKSSATAIQDALGKGKTYTYQGFYTEDDVRIEKIVRITTYNDFPDQAFYNVSYVNHSTTPLHVKEWKNHQYSLNPEQDSILFWSFQGETTSWRRDWVVPLKPGYYQKNFMGMNNPDYGGGIEIVDLWRKDYGLAIGMAEMGPKIVSLPVQVDSISHLGNIHIEQTLDNKILAQGDTLSTYQTFVQIHKGDHFATMQRYRAVLEKRGIPFVASPADAFESNWCAWGYGRNFTPDEVIGTLPKVKEMGIPWVTIDDGFQQAEGDWDLDLKKFPRGNKEMRELVDKIHSQGFKVMLWWAPLAADPHSKIYNENKDIISLSADGKPHDISWWDSYAMAPHSEKTLQHTRDVLKLFFEEWNVDGLKMDGHHLNAVNPDYGDKHLHHPNEAFERLPEYWKFVWEESNRLKPGAILQHCPCGACMSIFNMPYMNQSVSSDPTSSWQIRLKGKTYKAIIPEVAYYGDHVELSDNRTDFATSFGIGAVLGTKFTWPKENPTEKEDNLLSPEREASWKKWFGLYHEKMLSKELYRGELYDIGYDIPETHVIQKGDTMYYAFYNADFTGEIELRGLKTGAHTVRDYVNDNVLGEVSGNEPRLHVSFKDYLLIEVYPK